MKILENKLKIVLIAIVMMAVGTACNETDPVTYSGGDDLAIADPFLQIGTPVISFQGGTSSYNVQFNVINGAKTLTKVQAFAIFTDITSGKKSDKTEIFTVTVKDPKKEAFNVELTYDDLKDGFEVNGKPLPASDVDIAVGSGWLVSFVGTYEDGAVLPLIGRIDIAVLSKFAGLYTQVSGKYFRIGVDQGAYGLATKFIGSVDEDSFITDYVGPLNVYNFGALPWIFDVDLATLVITAPASKDEPLLGDVQINCTDNADKFTDLPCAGSNVIIPDDASGKHVMKLTYGYEIFGSGFRQFQEVLQKIPN